MQLLFTETRLRTVVCISGLALLSCLSGCSTFSAPEKTAVSSESAAPVKEQTFLDKVIKKLTPYRVPIQQGNFVSQEMVAQLKEGLTREQVSSLLGTPLLTDMFHEDRWDYPFRIRKTSGEIIKSHVAIFFKNNTVVKFEGIDLPTEKDYLAQISSAAIKEKIEVAPESEDASKK